MVSSHSPLPCSTCAALTNRRLGVARALARAARRIPQGDEVAGAGELFWAGAAGGKTGSERAVVRADAGRDGVTRAVGVNGEVVRRALWVLARARRGREGGEAELGETLRQHRDADVAAGRC